MIKILRSIITKLIKQFFLLVFKHFGKCVLYEKMYHMIKYIIEVNKYL